MWAVWKKEVMSQPLGKHRTFEDKLFIVYLIHEEKNRRRKLNEYSKIWTCFVVSGIFNGFGGYLYELRNYPAGIDVGRSG